MVRTFRFGEFELNLRAEVLTKSGVRVRLAGQPLKLLALLVRRAGELVTREDIRQALWTNGSVVDFDHAVNQYIRQLRSALGDNRESPLYIDTAPRRGYRFIAPVSAEAETSIATTPLQPEYEGQRDRPSQAIGATADIAAIPAGTLAVGASRSRAVLLSVMAVLIAGVALIAVVHLSQAMDNRSQAPRVEASRQAGAAPASVPGSLTSESRAAYLKGKYFFNQSTTEGFQKACGYFQRALDADPAYAVAYKGMADCFMALSSAGLATAGEAMPKAKVMARKAIELDDSLAEGHMALGIIHLNYDWDWPAARAEFQRAISLEPSNIDAHFGMAAYYRVVGQVDAAARELRWVQALDPVLAKTYHNLGWLYVSAGRYEDAGAELQKCVELAPNNPYAHFGLFMAYHHTGKHALGMSELQQFLTLQNETEIAKNIAQTYRSTGYARARRQFFELNSAAYVQRHFLAYQIAGDYALLGEKLRALDYLEQAYREHSNHMTHLKVDSYFDSVRNEPRFQQLMRQMRLTDEQLAQGSQDLAAVNR
jgi:DNA-binding winged helix-turn-helix (wHTH) protein/Tfp pilus assembly protein PilF